MVAKELNIATTVVGLIKALENYDIFQGVLFTVFKEHYTERKMLAQRYGFCEDCHSVFYMDTEDLDEYGCQKRNR